MPRRNMAAAISAPIAALAFFTPTIRCCPALPTSSRVRSTTRRAFRAQVHIQTADRIDWMKDAHALPEFERYPPQG